MKTSLKIAASMLCMSIVFGGCGKNQATQEALAGHYTYRTTSEAPSTFSPTDWQMGSESTILGYTVSPLYDFVMNEAQDGYEITCEMAAAFPVDVTTKYAGTAPYNVPSGATEGWAWHIDLNKQARWEDGTPITANDYEYSLRQFIHPAMKNYRSKLFTADGLVIANAEEYYSNGEKYSDVCIEPGVSYADIPDEEMFVSLTQKTVFFGESLEAAHNEHAEYFTNASGADVYQTLKELIGTNEVYVPLTPQIKAVLIELSALCGDMGENAYKEYCFSRKALKKVTWDEVGFIKENDYAFTVVLEKPLTEFMIMYRLAMFYIIKEDLYEANKKQTGNIVKSSYGTSKEKFSSCGPYKIKAYQPEKSIQLEKNDQWYGWKDGARQHQIQTTDIDIQFISEHSTILNLFLQGKLDKTALTADDLDKYGNSEYREDSPQSFTAKISFNIDKAALKKEESSGINHSLISYIDFRHALSLCIDRRRYIDTIVPTNEPGYGIINTLYIADPATNSTYRSTPQAERMLCEFYGTDTVQDITGYNKDAATVLFQKAYEAAVAAGDLLPTDVVTIDVHIYIANPGNVRTIAFLQDSVNAATQGTGLEGKVRFNQVIDEDYYNNMKKGNVDVAFTLWGGDMFDPYSILKCYCDPDTVNEYGFHPDKENLTLTINGLQITKTYYDWYIALNKGEYSTADFDTRNTILAGVEKALLEMYNMIPYRYMYSTSLHSQRIENASDHYINAIVEFGGFNFMRYTLDDAEWEAYCKQNKYKLVY